MVKTSTVMRSSVSGAGPGPAFDRVRNTSTESLLPAFDERGRPSSHSRLPPSSNNSAGDDNS